jgi:hypothetical protein
MNMCSIRRLLVFPNRPKSMGTSRMAKSIEEQIHAVFIQREEDRCRTLEEADPSHKTITRRVVKKPWIRSGPKALCQEADLLLLVRDYSFDLADVDFERYCADRGVLYVAGEKNSARWILMNDHSRTKAEFLNDPYFQKSVVEGGEQYQYSPGEMEIHWQIALLGKAKLQDCWELYKGNGLSDGT